MNEDKVALKEMKAKLMALSGMRLAAVRLQRLVERPGVGDRVYGRLYREADGFLGKFKQYVGKIAMLPNASGEITVEQFTVVDGIEDVSIGQSWGSFPAEKFSILEGCVALVVA